MSVIYRLTDSNNHFYIGSTTNLQNRLKHHRSSHNKCSSKKLCDDWSCDILEHTDKVGDDLLWLERRYFDSHYGSPLFVNEQKPIRTKEELKEYKQQHYQQYYEQNKDNIKAYKQQYREQNRERINERRQQHYQQNKEYCQQYYEQNKDKIKAYKSEKIHCECGAVITRSGKSQHLKTKKHLVKS